MKIKVTNHEINTSQIEIEVTPHTTREEPVCMTSWLLGKDITEHMDRVANFARSFGAYLRLSPKELNDLYLGGKFHDIGKVLVDKSILNKPGNLTEKELDTIKTHPELSMLLIDNIPGVNKEVERIILEHHERVDGSGYPKGKGEDEIFYLSKIVAICDSYDAMRSDRCYKKGMTLEEALIEIERCLGTQFDEKLGKEFIQFLQVKQ